MRLTTQTHVTLVINAISLTEFVSKHTASSHINLFINLQYTQMFFRDVEKCFLTLVIVISRTQYPNVAYINNHTIVLSPILLTFVLNMIVNTEINVKPLQNTKRYHSITEEKYSRSRMIVLSATKLFCLASCGIVDWYTMRMR